MIGHCLIKDRERFTKVQELLTKKTVILRFAKDRDELIRNAVKEPSSIFLLEGKNNSEVEGLDLIRDLRLFFGSFPAIMVFYDRANIINSANFLNAGADSLYSSPYDVNVVEDFLSRRVDNELFLPIHYRNIPSGGSPVVFSREIFGNELSLTGLSFKSSDFIPRGTLFNLRFPFIDEDFTLKVIRNQMDGEYNESKYSYFAEFEEINEEQTLKLRTYLDSSS